MLNLSFSKKINRQQKTYKLSNYLTRKIKLANTNFNTGPEMRLQEEYGNEIWLKIYKLGLKEEDFKNKKIIDICSGTGFLTYHILSKIEPKEITLLDISKEEIEQAKILLDKKFPSIKINYRAEDITLIKDQNDLFDIVIGNSFIHHFYDIPEVFRKIKNILKKDGLFITLHEPTPAAIVYESGNIILMLMYVIFGNKIFNLIRYKGEDVSDNINSDVWVFNQKELLKLLKDSGFIDIKTYLYNIVRPIIFSIKKMHLSNEKRILTKKELYFFKKSLVIDKFLNKKLPTKMFGGICLCAKK